MKKSDFLSELKEDGKLKLVEPSKEIRESYLEKADNCLKSARLLLKNDLYENSISMSYYTMYNSLTALLFRAGIKCESHSASIILLKKLFERPDLFKIISFAKKERIDKQYYVDFTLTEESVQDLLKKAENFLIEIKLMIKNIKNEDIHLVRNGFNKLF